MTGCLRDVGGPLSTEDVAARLACAELIVAGFGWADEGRATALADLFTEDGVHAIGADAVVGRDQIRAVLAVREADTARRTLHVISNIRFARTSADGMTATSLLTLYLLSAPEDHRLIPRALARVDDEFRQDAGDRWWLASRTTTLVAGQR
jgi:hypothetical protein